VYEQAAKSTVVVRNLDSGGMAKGMGSGVVLPGGDVATNCHVVRGASTLKVRIGDKEYPATLRYSDWDRDVCSLSVVEMNVPPAVIGSTKALKVGTKVYAIGAPKGLALSLSDGIVSNLREVKGGRYIQTTAAISPGSSGGGLFDEDGALVGLTTFYLADGQNLNFAIPIEWVTELPKRTGRGASTDQPATKWLNRAIELERRKDWNAMIEHCHRWTKAQPGSDLARFILGIAYRKSGQLDKAIEAYQQAIRINPEYAEAWGNLGVAYGSAGEHAKAVDAYRQALHINPEDPIAWNNLGFSYGRAGQIAKAIEAFQQGLRMNPEDAVAWSNLGAMYGRSGQNAKAIEAYQQSLRITPEDSNTWYNLGNDYVEIGQSAKAIEAYQQSLRISPEDSNTWYNLGVAFAISGQRNKVLEVYKRLKTLNSVHAERFFNAVVVP
jgi:tetratricopeptide (TPR) repeat protein